MSPIDAEIGVWINSLSPCTADAPEPIVDVIVPVYGNLTLVLKCIRSVLTSTNRTPHELIVIDDASPTQPGEFSLLQQLSDLGYLTLLRNEHNLGFPGTCNRGFDLHPDRDVLILNSDTEVFGDWLDRLRAAAQSDASIATVTALTNDGEIASYPRFCRPNTLDLELAASDLDKLAADVNAGSIVEVPTGVGFCMYVRRAALRQLVGFDAERFGKGYGEENDLCRRAAELGWRNVIAPNTFVLHHGGGSFGPSKLARIQAALEILEELHPGYGELVADFIASDPLQPYREALDIARTQRLYGRPRFLFITHNWGGGVERHVRDLTTLLESEGASVYLCRPGDNDPDIMQFQLPSDIDVPNLPSVSTALSPSYFVKALESLSIDHVHVHNLAGYGPATKSYLTAGLRAAGIPYDVTLHDYQSFCPQNHLVDISEFYCGEPAEQSCTNCVKTLGSPYGEPIIWHWRRESADLLKGARVVFSPSKDTARRIARHFPDIVPRVTPHPELPIVADDAGRSWPRASQRVSGTIRIGLIGAVSTPKGSKVLRDVALLSAEKETPIHFVVIGTTDIDDILEDFDNVEVIGKYPESALTALLDQADLDLIWFPAVWPETYSYTLSAALRTGLEIVSFDLGAVAERLRSVGRGTILPMMSMLDPVTILSSLLAAAQKEELTPTSVEVQLDSEAYSVIRDYYGRPEWVRTA